ncbi:EF-hand domain-containing protein [Kushneria avicenniae]|nr:EF-hand domain-containing protein [Kushneria avicenniae]
MLIMLAGCARHSTQEPDPAQADATLGSRLDADQVFDQAKTASDGHLGALDIERLGLGNHWNMLDQNGDGRVSRQEFHRRFDDPAIQRQLQAHVSSAATSEQAVSDAWRLPPKPPSQRWQRAGTLAAPATSSAPSAAAWGRATPPSEGQAPAESDASADNEADSISP